MSVIQKMVDVIIHVQTLCFHMSVTVLMGMNLEQTSIHVMVSVLPYEKLRFTDISVSRLAKVPFHLSS